MLSRDLTNRQIFFLTCLFSFGNTSLIGTPYLVANGYIALAVGAVIAIPTIKLFKYMASDAKPICAFRQLLGKKIGTVVVLLYAILSVFVSAASISSFLDFIAATATKHTPRELSAALLGLTVFLLLHAGRRAMAVSARVVFPIVLAFLIFTFVLSIPQLDYGAILPVLQGGVAPLADQIVSVTAMYIAQLFFLVLIVGGTSKEKNWDKSMYRAVLLVLFVLALTNIRDIMVLGVPMMEISRYPSYTASMVLQFSSLLQRSEFLISGVYLLCQPFRAAISLHFAQLVGRQLAPRFEGYFAPALSLSAVIAGLALNSGRVVTAQEATRYDILLLLLAIPFAIAIISKIRQLKNAETP